MIRLLLLLALPGCASQLLREARHESRQGGFMRARLKLEKALRQKPHFTEACLLLAQLHHKDRAYDHAVKVLRDCGADHDLSLREQLGLSLYKTDIPPPPESITVLEQVIAERPGAIGALLQLATHYLKAQPKRATDLLLQYLAHRPREMSASDDLIRDLLDKVTMGSSR